MFRFLFRVSLLLLVCIGCTRHEEEPTGLIVLGSAEHDFGRHHQEEMLAHEFTLVNKLLVAVKIIELKTSCGCLMPGEIEETIAPGASASLPIRFTTGAAQETASGNIIVAYRQASDVADSGQPEYVRLRVRADVIPDYRISPRKINCGMIDGLAVQQVTRVFRVAPEAMPDMEIQEVHSLSSFLKARILPKEMDDSAIRVEVTLDVSRFTHGKSFCGSVVFSTNSKRVPKAIVYVRGKYNAPAQVEPNTIVIASNERGEVERELRVTTNHDARVRGVQCSSSDKRVRNELNSQLVARKHVLHLFVAPCQEKPLDCEVQLQLELFTDGGRSTFRTIRVPVHRFLQKGIENE